MSEGGKCVYVITKGSLKNKVLYETKDRLRVTIEKLS